MAAHLAGRYGTETPAVLALSEGRPELLQPLVAGLHYLQVEALFAVREEMAMTISDVLDRRTRASLRDARAAGSAATRVATLIGPELGWDEERMASEADAYAESVRSTLARAGLSKGRDPVLAGHGPSFDGGGVTANGSSPDASDPRGATP
jgi:glycerol-3-phosphate dehydrogenase